LNTAGKYAVVKTEIYHTNKLTRKENAIRIRQKLNKSNLD